MTELVLTTDMAAFIKAAPRSWREIPQKCHWQPYALIYRAFGNLCHQLGRAGDSPRFRYTFSDRDFAFEPPPVPETNFDPRHRNL